MTTRTNQYTYVDQQLLLDEAIGLLSASPYIGVDTEADSRHRYPEKVCLLQLSNGDNTYLIDTLASLDYSGLHSLFSSTTTQKILHGADFDIRGLNRDFGSEFFNCFDTSIAARFANHEKFGLAALLENILNIAIPKDERLQKADWSRRPLSTQALEYAAADVVFLPELRNTLHNHLSELNRIDWVLEECERIASVKYIERDRETAYLSVKGTRDLDGRGLAILKQLFDFRESTAIKLNRPPGFILPAAALAFISANPEKELSGIPGIGGTTLKRFGKQIREAVRSGLVAEPLMRPKPKTPALPRPTKTQSTRLSALKKWRSDIGIKLSLDASLLWPMKSLERIARDPRTIDNEFLAEEIRQWQISEFSDSLRNIVSSLA